MLQLYAYPMTARDSSDIDSPNAGYDPESDLNDSQYQAANTDMSDDDAGYEDMEDMESEI